MVNCQVIPQNEQIPCEQVIVAEENVNMLCIHCDSFEYTNPSSLVLNEYEIN